MANHQPDASPAPKTTNLTMPGDLYARVEAEAQKDRRTVRPELVVLVEEALNARDKRRA